MYMARELYIYQVLLGLRSIVKDGLDGLLFRNGFNINDIGVIARDINKMRKLNNLLINLKMGST